MAGQTGVSAYCCETVHRLASVAVMMNLTVAALGAVPESTPVLESSVSQVGSAVALKVTGVAVVPLAVIVCKYAVPTTGTLRVAGLSVITGQILTWTI